MERHEQSSEIVSVVLNFMRAVWGIYDEGNNKRLDLTPAASGSIVS